MITAGAVVVASFFTVSAVTQLHGVLVHSATSPSRIKNITFYFKACAFILFGGNGLIWVLETSNAIDCSSVDMQSVTSTVAILAALAFISALMNFFVSTIMLNVSASLLLITAHEARADRICGSVSIMLGSSVILFALTCAFSLFNFRPRSGQEIRG